MKEKAFLFPVMLVLSACVLSMVPACSSGPNAPANDSIQLTNVQQLGKLVFFDGNLSSPPGMACAACHDPAAGFADPDANSPVSEGVLAGRFGSRVGELDPW